MRILLTGFEPFGGSLINPSQLVVETLAGQSWAGVDLSATILPIDRYAGPETLLAALDRVQPEAVLCLSEASRRAAISIERVAINLMDYRVPDNSGEQPVDQPIAPDGPAAYFVTLPVKRLLEAVTAIGVPAELSLSAGSFVCNQVLYVLLHTLAARGLSIPAGMIHLPSLPEQVCRAQPAIPSMCPDISASAIRAVIETLADPAGTPLYRPPVPVTGIPPLVI